VPLGPDVGPQDLVGRLRNKLENKIEVHFVRLYKDDRGKQSGRQANSSETRAAYRRGARRQQWTTHTNASRPPYLVARCVKAVLQLDDVCMTELLHDLKLSILGIKGKEHSVGRPHQPNVRQTQAANKASPPKNRCTTAGQAAHDPATLTAKDQTHNRHLHTLKRRSCSTFLIATVSPVSMIRAS
jgi:hypothetical protein